MMHLKKWNSESLKLSYMNILKTKITKIEKSKDIIYKQQPKGGQQNILVLMATRNHSDNEKNLKNN